MSSSERNKEIKWLIDFLEYLRMRGRSYLSGGERRMLELFAAKIREKRSLTPKETRLLANRIDKLRHVVPVDPIHIKKFKKITRSLGGLARKELLNSFKKEFQKQIKEAKEKRKKINVVFMFGSGASHPPPSNIPTVNEMLGYLVERLPPTEVPFASKVKDWAARPGVNIEDILTAGYLGVLLVSKPIVNRLVGEIIYRELAEEVGELREREYVFSFQDLVKRVFSMVSGMMAKSDSNIVHESVAKLIKNLENDETLEFSITTTNYDVCIEKAFEKHGLKHRYLGIGEEKGIPVVKIHGSINWFYCEGCQSVITFSIKELEAFKKIFPTSGSCQRCVTPTSQLMVPPIAYKYVMFPPLIDIWQAAMRTIEKADVIVVVGYSFSLADDYIFKMIVSGIKKKKSVLVFLNRDLEAISNLEDKLAAYHLKLPFAVVGEAEKTVPLITRIIEETRTQIVKKARKRKNKS